MHICTVIKIKDAVLVNKPKQYVSKQDLDDDSNGAQLTSFGIKSRTKEKANENERSPCVCRFIKKRNSVGAVASVAQM